MRKKNRMGLNIGTSSILLVFVLLCMVTFAALSYVSANADYKLSRSLADRTSAYYDAVNSAEEALALLDEQLAQLAADSAGTSAYLEGIPGLLKDTNAAFSPSGTDTGSTDTEGADTGGTVLGTLTWQAPINDTQALEVSLNLTDPFSSDTRYIISQWQVVQTQTWEDGSTLNLYDGS